MSEDADSLSLPIRTSQKHKTPWIKVALITFPIVVLCMAGFFVLMRQRAKTQAIACENNLKRLGFVLSLYTDNHDGKFPSAWADLTNEMADRVNLHFLAGTENSPLSSIQRGDLTVFNDEKSRFALHRTRSLWVSTIWKQQAIRALMVALFFKKQRIIRLGC